MAEITCGYVTLPDSGAQLHYRTAGSGPPLIMLHPSPQNSQVLEPAMQVFAADCTCIALDTPGYGLSDDPTPDNATLRDYADVVFNAADALGIDRFFLYGAATGAQIAIEMGKHQPQRLPLVLLDANGHIDADERERVMQGYFPPVTPHRDGRHLLTYWDMCSNLFARFPWNSTDPADRLPIPQMPAAFVQATLLRYLDAGKSYAKAYREAFHAEDIAHLEGFKAQAVMTRWEGSAVLRIADDFIAHGLPENVRVLNAGSALEERYGVQLEALREAQAAVGLAGYSPKAPSGPAASGRCYLPTTSGQLHGWQSADGEGATVVLLHSAGRSMSQWDGPYSQLKGNRPVIALDLPGHGHTRVGWPENASIADLAQLIAEALRDLGLAEVELVGEGLGAAIALQLQEALPASRVTIVDPLPYADFADSVPLADLAPKESGAHLTEAWHIVQQDALRWPWWSGAVEHQREVPLDQSPDVLHLRASDILRAGDRYQSMMALEFGTDWQALLSQAKDSRLVVTPHHPRPAYAEDLAATNVSLRRINDLSDLFD